MFIKSVSEVRAQKCVYRERKLLLLFPEGKAILKN